VAGAGKQESSTLAPIRIEIDRESIRKCLSSECSFCRENCPSYIAFQLDSYSSRGKNRIIKAYLEGEVGTDELREALFTCTICGQCSEVCLTDGAVFNQVREIRSQLVEMGHGLKGHREMVDYIKEKHTPYGVKDRKWMGSEGEEGKDEVKNKEKDIGKDKENDKEKDTGKGTMKDKEKDMGRDIGKGKEKDKKKDRRIMKGKIAYFPGCTIQAEHPEFALKTLKLLDKLGIRIVPLSEPCCGSPVLGAGYREEARAIAGDFLDELKERRINTIITSCTGCTAMLKLEYPELTGKKLKVQHITEVLAKNRKKLKVLLTNGTFKTHNGSGSEIFYHDPCDLARKLHVMKEPREVLETLGFVLREFDHNNTATVCCGGGGGFARDYSDGAESAAEKRVREARELGGRRIVTTCLSCRKMLKRASGGKTEVLDLIELVNL